MRFLKKVQAEDEGNPEFEKFLKEALEIYNKLDDKLASASVRVSGDRKAKFDAARKKLDSAVNALIKIHNGK